MTRSAGRSRRSSGAASSSTTDAYSPSRAPASCCAAARTTGSKSSLVESPAPMPAATGERLDDLLWAGAHEQAALVTAETGDVLTYERLHDEVAVLARRLASAGVGRGSRVGLVLPDGPDFL